MSTRDRLKAIAESVIARPSSNFVLSEGSSGQRTLIDFNLVAAVKFKFSDVY